MKSYTKKSEGSGYSQAGLWKMKEMFIVLDLARIGIGEVRIELSRFSVI